MITLHHGSNVAIDTIDLSKSKAGKDFGKGFYLNPDYSQAQKWAETRVDFYFSGSPIVSSYEFDIEKARENNLKIKIFDDYSPEWADFVVSNRRNNSDSPIHDFDIIIGPIADDSVGNQIRRYMAGQITLSKLVEEIRYHGNRAIQYYFATERSLRYLKPKL